MKYPIGIQSFEKIRDEGYAYVDKTSHIYRLASEGNYYFLSRPRRFGKSLLLSTMKAYFEGKRELFKGLAIEQMEQEWKQYTVLYLDLNAEKYTEEGSLDSMLNHFLLQWEELYGTGVGESTLSTRFKGVITRAAKQSAAKRVVILVDEYDKPLLETFDKPELQEDYRATLKAFYGNLKSCDEYIRFAFLTGVTKFGKVSVFSDLNHLTDLTLDKRFYDICGISEKELHYYFDEGVQEVADANGMSKDECYVRLKNDFDGYHFGEGTPGIYNPFSLLSTLRSKQFGDYWFETGTPTFLVQQLLKTDYPLERMTTEDLTADTLNSIDIMNQNPLPLLFQSGYLTIKEYDPVFNCYTLGFPNREVEQGFTQFLSNYYLPLQKGGSTFDLRHFVREIQNGEAEKFMNRLVVLFADGDYRIVGDREVYFQNTLYVFFKLLGFYVDVERHTSDGRMDVLMQTKDYIYIIEIKVGQSAEVAMQQIEERHYAAPFDCDPRRLFKIGINFNSTSRTIDDWCVK